MHSSNLAPQTDSNSGTTEGLNCAKSWNHKGRGVDGLDWVGCEVGRKMDFDPNKEAYLLVPNSVLNIESNKSKTFDLKSIFFTSYVQQMFFQHRQHREGFYQIKGSTIKFLLGSSFYLPIIEYLTDNGIIERDNHYIIGEKAIGYRIAPSARGNIKRILIKNKTIAKKINQLREMKIQTRNETERKLAEIIRDRVEIMNPFFVIDYAKSIYQGESLVYAVMAIDALENGDIFFCSDPKTGRVFSNISNFPRELRGTLMIDRQPTVEVDIKCAQPLFLAGLYEDGEPEKEKFLDVVLNKDFYTWLGEKSGAKWDSRDLLKEKIFIQVFFDRLRQFEEKDGRLWIGFKEQFPVLSKAIKGVKTPDHSALALRLQSIEAKVMISGAAQELLGEGIPIATVHDSIICKEGDKDRVVEAIKSNCKRVMGVEPQVSVK